jgi:hypothetical protein
MPGQYRSPSGLNRVGLALFSPDGKLEFDNGS